jgi:hypothetical protein
MRGKGVLSPEPQCCILWGVPSRRTPTPPKSRKSRKGTAPANETTDDGASSSRPLWTGSIGFGLVQIPVRLYTRERSNDLAFHQVDRRDHALIGYERINRNTHRPVAWGDIVKGYEIEKGQFVIVTDEDFEKANVQASRSIEIQDFVASVAIAPAFFDRPYLALPGAPVGPRTLARTGSEIGQADRQGALARRAAHRADGRRLGSGPVPRHLPGRAPCSDPGEG